MPDSPQLSTYTPSNTEPEILEKIFVQRHKLLERTVAWCEESITTDKKNHLLFVGPRGSGKTHFIAMVVNRLKHKPELEDKMVIIWLGEDDVITSLMDLFLLMLENLVKNNPERFNDTCLQQAKGQKPDTVAEIIMHSITEQIGQQTILLLKENMSDVFTGLKDGGQKKLRAFLQEKNNIAILGTSQQLFPGVSSRDAAFFGFFDTHHLKVLTVDEAKQLISNIAKLNKNQKLIAFLETPQGCYRVRALHHLAGGNHRLYVELSSFLTMASLDDFVSALTLLADSLTPYFQERVRSLPAQQGRIVQKLCEIQGATPVKMIAEETFIGERSVAKQLGDLAKKGYVISHKRGKQSYYEMAEPLMRLALEVKNSQGKPLRMVALLLRAWFSDNELQTEDEKHGITADYKIAALSMDKAFLVSINDKIGEQMEREFDSNDYEKAILTCNEIINGPQTDGEPREQKYEAILNRGASYCNSNKIKGALQDFTTLLEMQDLPAELKVHALLNRSNAYGKNDESELALQDLTTLLELEEAPAKLKANALFNRSLIYEQNDENEPALQDLTTLLELEDAPAEPKANALFNRSFIYQQNDESEPALQDLTTLLEMEDTPAELKANALFNCSLIYNQNDGSEPALQDLTTLLEMEDAPAELKANTLFHRSLIYEQNDENEHALQDLTTLLEIEDAPAELKAKGLINRSLIYDQNDESEPSLDDLTTLLEMEDAPAELKAKGLINRSLIYKQNDENEHALQDLTTVLEMEDAPEELKACALLNRNVIYRENDEIKYAFQDLTALFEMQGLPTELKAYALLNRSVTYRQNDEIKRELQDLTTVLEMEDAPKHTVIRALFSVPEAHFKCLQIKQAQQSLNEAFNKGEKTCKYYPSNTNNILQAINQLGSSFWQDQIAWIIPLYAEHKELGNLSTAIIHSVTFFIEDESMLSSINKWQQLWQKHGEKYQELQLSLQALRASVLTIEQKNDKPLFSLPKEVRELVLPLLTKVLN